MSGDDLSEFESAVKYIEAEIASPSFHVKFQCTRSAVFRVPDYFERLPMLDDMVAVSVEDEGLTHVLQENGMREILANHGQTFVCGEKRCVQFPTDAIPRIRGRMRRIGKMYDRHMIGTISIAKWDRIIDGATLDQGSLTFDSPAHRSRVFLELARRWPLPPQCMVFKYKCLLNRTEKILVYLYKRAVLLRAYIALYDLFSYDMEELDRHVSLLNAAYDKSIESFDHKAPKIDYELVVLSNMQNMSRLHETCELDPSASTVPTYWFDGTEYKNKSVGELRSIFAIKDEWNKASYLITYQFPAGAMFLRTRVESQGFLYGGAEEYIYLHNMSTGRVLHLAAEEPRLLHFPELRSAKELVKLPFTQEHYTWRHNWMKYTLKLNRDTQLPAVRGIDYSNAFPGQLIVQSGFVDWYIFSRWADVFGIDPHTVPDPPFLAPMWWFVAVDSAHQSRSGYAFPYTPLAAN